MSSILNLSNLKDKISSKLSLQGSSRNQKPGKDSKKKDLQKPKEYKQEEVKSKETKKKDNKGENSKKSKQSSVVSDGKNLNNTNEILRQEALALGATEEDLKLLQGIESDDEKSEIEFDDDSKLDKEFGNDLSKFIKDIGLGNGEAVVIDDESIEEVDGSDSIEEEEEEGEDVSLEDGISSSESSSDEEEEEKEEEEEVPELVQDTTTNSTTNGEDGVVVKEADLKKSKIKKVEKEENADEITDFSMVSSGKLAVPNRLDWYNIYPLTNTDALPKLDRFARERLLERGQKTLDKDNKVYLEEFASNSSQKKFLSQILSDGTLNDKISALTLLVQEAPLHNLKALDTLLLYCDKKSRTAALQSIAALKDLLLNGLLPDRKLFAFDKQPLSKDESSMTDAQLAVFCFEDHLKKTYFKLLQILERLLQDPIVHVRMNALNHVFDLLKSKPEQEVNLLKLGVNKLGDTDNKVAAKASYLILQLEQTHPAMKKIVTDAVIDVIFQSTTDDHSKYYGVTTLNQTIITRREDELANSLVKTYFALFEKVLIESNFFAKSTGDSEKDKLIGESQKGRKNNRKNFKKGKKGGKSVKQEEKSQQEIIEEKNSKMFSALLTGLNRAFPFCNLPNEIFQSHLDTLFKITHSSNFNTAIQALVLINHIITKQELNSDRYYRTLYESLLDSRLVNTSKQGIYLNLLYKSLKNDSSNIPRVLAFVKRIIQVIAHWLNVGAIAGMLYLLMELSKSMPEIGDLLIDVNSRPDEEKGDDANKEPSAEIEGSDKTDSISIQQVNVYDPKKRDPNYANADKSSLWEIDLFVNHFHPTVSLYASSFIDGTPQTKPDLGLYTLAHFLDRFVYKNAKQKPQTKGSSIMQPLGGAHTGELLVRSTNVLDHSIPANTENWLNKKVNDIRADERFFHQYFTTKVNKLKKKTKEEDEEKEGEDRDENGMDDDEVWKALVNSRPDVEASSGDEMSDLDPEDFSDLDDDEEVELLGEDEDGGDFDDGEINEFDRPLSVGNDIDDNDNSDAEFNKFIDDEAEEDFDDEFDEDEAKMFNINDDDELSDSEVDIKMLEDMDVSGGDGSEEEEQKPVKQNKKRKSDKEEDNSSMSKKKSKRPRIKDLPLFASAEDYADKL